MNARGNRTFIATMILLIRLISEVQIGQTFYIYQLQPQGRNEYEEAIRLYERIGDRYSIARGKAHYGLMLMNSGDSARGLNLLSEAREGCVAIKYEGGVQWIDNLLAEKEKSEGPE